MMPMPSCASSRCRCRAARRCPGRPVWRSGRRGASCRFSTWTRWEIVSYDDGQRQRQRRRRGGRGRRRRRPTGHVQSGWAGLCVQHLSGRADLALRGARPAAEGAGISRRRAAVSGWCDSAGRLAQAPGHRGATAGGYAHRHSRVRGRQDRCHCRCGHRSATGGGAGGDAAAGNREGAGGRIHRRSRGEEWPHDCGLEHEQAAQRNGEAGFAGSDMMGETPVAALRREYDAIARQLEGAPGNAEREAAKREIIAFFKKVDVMLGEMSQLKDDIRQLVDRYKQLAADTKQASAPEFTGQRPVLHADHIGATTFIEKGWSLISLGDHAGAIQALTKALQLSPGETQAESLLGWAQMLHEDYDDALGTFQKVLMKEPANSLARINVGYICLKKRIFGEAIEHLSKAIRLDNDKKATLYAHFYLGLVYLQREMYEDAQTFFQKTLKLGPNLIEAYYELGRARWFAGEQDQAKQTWTDGFKANKFNPWGKKCQDMLELVGKGEEPPRD